MMLTLKNGRLYDIKEGKFVKAFADWFGHGDHDKQPLPKTKKVRFIPYRCECGALLIDLHEGNLFKD